MKMCEARRIIEMPGALQVNIKGKTYIEVKYVLYLLSMIDSLEDPSYSRPSTERGCSKDCNVYFDKIESPRKEESTESGTGSSSIEDIRENPVNGFSNIWGNGPKDAYGNPVPYCGTSNEGGIS